MRKNRQSIGFRVAAAAALVSLGIGCGSRTPTPTDAELKATKQAFEAEIAAARRDGLPTLPSELNGPDVPSARNAAPLYRKLHERNKTAPKGSDGEVAALLARVSPSSDQAGRANDLLAKNRDILKLVRDIASRPDCDFRRDWSMGPLLLTPEHAAARSATRWLAGESGRLMRSGKPLDAVRSMALGFRIAAHLEQQPGLIAYLVSLAVDAITFRGLESILYAHAGWPEVAGAVRQAIEANWRPRSLRNTVRGEMVMALVSLDMITHDGVAALTSLGIEGYKDLSPEEVKRKPTDDERRLLDLLRARNGVLTVAHFRRFQPLADRPFPEAIRLAPVLPADFVETKDPGQALAALLMIDTRPAVEKRAMNQAKAAVLRSAAAVLAWKARHGRYPAKLSDAITTVPTDPFDLKPLRFRREGAGFAIYSVGETGAFDGHASDVKQYNGNAVFVWPLPQVLRQTQGATAP